MQAVAQSRCARSAIASAFVFTAATAIIGETAIAASLTDLRFSTVVSGGLISQPTSVTSAPADGRLFITERTGRIRVVSNGVLQPTPFLDLTSIVNSGDERGLFHLAFSHDFATSGVLYAAYNQSADLDLVVSKITVNPSAASNPTYTSSLVVKANLGAVNNHHGGWIGFRPGDPQNLFVSVGDANNPGAAQSLDGPLNGKILRVSTSGFNTPAAGNPFLGNANLRDDLVWAYGLRNVWKASFDRQTGDLYLGDVGNNSREELNVERASHTGGSNYGWLFKEGDIQNPQFAGTVPTGLTDPQLAYPHHPAQGGLGVAFSPTASSASITTGITYRGSELPFLTGSHLFGDFSSGRFAVTSYDTLTNALSPYTEITATLNPSGSAFNRFQLVSFGEDAQGEIYALNYGNGALLKLTAIPEPAALSLLCPSLALLARRTRR